MQTAFPLKMWFGEERLKVALFFVNHASLEQASPPPPQKKGLVLTITWLRRKSRRARFNASIASALIISLFVSYFPPFCPLMREINLLSLSWYLLQNTNQIYFDILPFLQFLHLPIDIKVQIYTMYRL